MLCNPKTYLQWRMGCYPAPRSVTLQQALNSLSMLVGPVCLEPWRCSGFPGVPWKRLGLPAYSQAASDLRCTGSRAGQGHPDFTHSSSSQALQPQHPLRGAARRGARGAEQRPQGRALRSAPFRAEIADQASFGPSAVQGWREAEPAAQEATIVLLAVQC